ncbi:hypothetical protein NM208_g4149 [Fusarium decemcellulare]|uniref:Uncharacterized protein n=1 Tax=Fusarium decemcellulare TaxID=57161 RepID=A0ACC1SLT7_9HYPO|nr:hypothetical protein NM208_g4149 [Fusarium decemcellulare]
MSDCLVGDRSKGRGIQKRRSSRACQSCRAVSEHAPVVGRKPGLTYRQQAKTKYQAQPPLKTSKPTLSGAFCDIPSSSDDSSCDGWDLHADGVDVQTSCQDTIHCQIIDHTNDVEFGPEQPSSAGKSHHGSSHQSGTATPWNPHNLVMSTDRGNQLHRPTLARKLLQILGEFPVEDDASENGAAESKYQDPLWLVAGLAKRGWNLNGTHNNERKSRRLSELPPAELPTEEAHLLNKWTPQALQGIEKEQNRYFKHGVLGSKSDVASDLDPIQHGLVTEEKAAELFQAYWDNIHRQWAILDPSFHNLSTVRKRSALLTTTTLALGSTALAVASRNSKERVSEALSLHAHAEKLNLVVYATGARSIDIIQAQIVCIRHLFLDIFAYLRSSFHDGALLPEQDKAKAEALRWNDLRTRAFIIINEYRFFTYSGRNPMDLSHFEFNDSELEELTAMSREKSAVSLAALYHLFLFDSYMEKWIQDWCGRDSDHFLDWHLSHDAISCWLLLALCIARKRFPPSESTSSSQHQKQNDHQKLLLELSMRLFKGVLKTPHAVLMTHRASILPVAASIILKLGTKRDLVLRVALRMAGEPGKPYVPTFVRESGNQMLVMLCQNNAQSMPAQVNDLRPQEHSHNDENARRGKKFTIATSNAVTGFMPLFSQPTGCEDPFMFNFAEFPIISDQVSVQGRFQDPVLPCDSAAYVNSCVNAAYLGDSAEVARAAQINQQQTTLYDSTMPEAPSSNSFGCLTGMNIGTQMQSQAHHNTPAWGMEGSSPVTTTSGLGMGAGNGEIRNAQREALLSAVDRLMQLASLMHCCILLIMALQTSSDKPNSTHVEEPTVGMTGDTKNSQTEEVETQDASQKPKSISLIQSLRTYKHASIVCMLAAVGALSDGYQVQMSGSIIALPGFVRTFGDLQPSGKYIIEPQYLALWGSLKNVAAMFGAGIGSYPADKLGRRWMILVVQIIMIGSCILEQLAVHWTHWLGARLLDGFSIGLAQCCINVYISEMAPTPCRGSLMSLVQLFYTIGSFLSAVSLNVVSQDVPENWRHAVLSQFAFCGVALIAWAFLPESARWHCVQGREAECKKILQKVNGKVEGYDVDREYRKMLVEIERANVTASVQGGGTYWDVFRGTNRRRLIISFLPWHWQVAIGVPIIGTYSSYFYDMAGLANPFNGTVATNVVNIVMLLVAVPLIERLGRRTLLLWCAPISIMSLLVIGGILRASGPAVGPVLIAFACMWAVGYNLSAGPMGYIYVAETATTRLRAKTTGVAIIGIQAMATVYVYIPPIMLNSPAFGIMFFWAGTGSLVYILVWFLVPETKGRTFAELDELFDRGIPAWKFAKTKTTVQDDFATDQHEVRGVP